MSTSSGTAVVRRDVTSRLPDHIQASLEKRREARRVALQLRQQNWGKDLDERTLQAMVLYADRCGLDPATEVDVLGGSPYVNARFYYRKLGELRERGVIEAERADHIEADPRLLETARELDTRAGQTQDEETRAQCLATARQFEAEHYRRVMERAKHGIPDKAQSAVVFRIRVAGMAEEVVGASWAGGRGTKMTKYGEKPRDPIGDEEPQKTAETRAMRRAMLKLASHVPQYKGELQLVEESAVAIEGLIVADTERQEAARAALPMSDRSHHITPSEYGGGEDEIALSPAQVEAAADVEEDEYQDDSGLVSDELPLGETRRTRTAQGEGR